MTTSSTLPDIKKNGAATVTAQWVIAALKKRMEREKAAQARLEGLRVARMQHIAYTLLPAERAYRAAERTDAMFDAAIGELERSLKDKE